MKNPQRTYYFLLQAQLQSACLKYMWLLAGSDEPVLNQPYFLQAIAKVWCIEQPTGY